MEFSRQESWSEWPLPTPRDLPNPGIKPASPELAGGFFTTELPGKSMPWLPFWYFQLLFLEEWEENTVVGSIQDFFFFFQSLFSCNVVILYGNKLWLTHSRDISLKTFRVLICSKEAFTVFEAQIQWENKFSGASCILVQRACLWSPVLISKDIKN